MKIRFDSPDIPEDGFSVGDTFGRKHIAESIIALAQKVEGEFTIILDGPWGSGKTTFLRQFANLAESVGFPTIHFDAFKHDISGDAFPIIAGQILEKLNASKPKTEKIKETFLKAVSATGILAAKGALRVSAAAVTGGLLDTKNLESIIGNEEAAEAVSKGVGDVIDNSAVEAIARVVERYSEVEETLSTLQSALKEVSQQLVRKIKVDDTKNVQQRIFFVIDELDRCRPDFALELLECAKHFYQTENVIFLLSADISELLSTIRHGYGSGFDAERYLEKFYDIRLFLPLRNIDRVSIVKQYSHYALQQMPDDSDNGQYNRRALELLVDLAEVYDLSLRSFEKVCQRLMLVVAQTNERHARIVPAIVALCFTSVRFPERYDQLRTGRMSWPDFLKLFDAIVRQRDLDNGFNWMLNCMEYMLETDVASMSESAKEWQRYLSKYNFYNRERILPILSERFVDVFVSESGQA